MDCKLDNLENAGLSFSRSLVISWNSCENPYSKMEPLRPVFTWMSILIRVYFGFALLRLVIGLNSRHFLDQSEVKPKPTMTRSRIFSRASR